MKIGFEGMVSPVEPPQRPHNDKEPDREFVGGKKKKPETKQGEINNSDGDTFVLSGKQDDERDMFKNFKFPSKESEN